VTKDESAYVCTEKYRHPMFSSEAKGWEPMRELIVEDKQYNNAILITNIHRTYVPVKSTTTTLPEGNPNDTFDP
jgi:hypothetical protein